MGAPVIGLIGGIASGKSTVAAMFEALGAERVDADALAHEALRREDVRAAVVARFGADVLGGDGQIDRSALGARVFGDADDLAALEALVHPPVREAMAERIAAARAAGRAVLLDVPLLLEGGHDARCDVVVFVRTREETRRARAAARGWDDGELARREARQMPLADKEARADHALDNDGEIAETRAQVERIWAEIHQTAAGSRQDGEQS